MVINSNIAAAQAASRLGQSTQALSQSLARLSSGNRIVSPADDGAGLGVAMKLGAQVARTDAASSNVANALSFSQTQDGYLAKIGESLNRLSELSVLAQDATKTDSDRALYNQEFQSLTGYIQDVQSKDFNGVSLFSSSALNLMTDGEGSAFSMSGIQGGYVTPGHSVTTSVTTYPAATAGLGSISSSLQSQGTGTISLHGVSGTASHTFAATDTIQDFVDSFNSVGNGVSAAYNATSGQLTINQPAGETLDDQNDIIGYMGFNTSHSIWMGGNPLRRYNGAGANTAQLTGTTNTVTNTTTAMDVSTATHAASALTQLKAALNLVAADRANVGANMERLNYQASQLQTLRNNLGAATSQITDIDVATESTNYARQNILVQSGTAMLAQANQQPQSVLKLLG